MSAWHNRKVIVAVGGGIACYKTCNVVSQLVQAGAVVRVLMTQSATRFVGPMTFAALAGSQPMTSLWDRVDPHGSSHVELARWCQLMIVAPATADLMARMTTGLCDDVVTLVACALPEKTPVLLAPAMNAQMWANPITQRNVATLQEILGYHCVGPDTGWQACRTVGTGRMSEPQAIVDAAVDLLSSA